MIIWTKVKKDFFKKDSSYKFNSKKWLSIISKRLRSNFQNLKNNNYLNQFLASSPLPLMILNDSKSNINIADFGSGSQEIYFHLSLMNTKKKITIDSVEVEDLVSYFKKQNFSKRNIKIEFFNKFNFKKKYDYVHISDSLQYIYKWKDFLKNLNSVNNKFIIINNVPTGNNKTYVTKQNFYGTQIANVFFSTREICGLLNEYKLVFSSLFLNKIMGEYRSYPQNNFNKKDRINYPKTLIFKHKKFRK